MRCTTLGMSGRISEARKALAEVEARFLAVDDQEFRLDLGLARGLMALVGCESVNSAELTKVVGRGALMANAPGIDPIVRGSFQYGLCVIHNLKAEFGAALERAEDARRTLRGESAYLEMMIELECGIAAMAQGRVEDAANAYGRARRSATNHFLRDPLAGVLVQVYVRELSSSEGSSMKAQSRQKFQMCFARAAHRFRTTRSPPPW